MSAKVFVIAIASTAPILGCTPGSTFIRGSVIMQTATEAHINLGSEDGIQLGDTLVVWREEAAGASSRTVRVGMIRVVRVLERHAAVEVLRGNLRERDRVEKRVR